MSNEVTILVCTSARAKIFCNTKAKLVLCSVPKNVKKDLKDICILIGLELCSARLFD